MPSPIVIRRRKGGAIIGSLSISSVETLSQLNVSYDTQFASLSLPSTVNVTLSDGSVRALSVTWLEGSYDPQLPNDAQNIFGDLSLPAGVINPLLIQATISVVVAPLNADVIDYDARVTTAGGALQSGDTTLLNDFINNVGATIYAKIKDCGFFLGGFAGCFVKFKYANASFQNLLNTAFVSGDYSESAGLLSTTTTKFCDTQIIPANNGLDKNNFSMGCYMVANFSNAQTALMSDNETTGRGRIIFGKDNSSIYTDADVVVNSNTLVATNVNDPHFTAVSFGTNIHVMMDYQANVDGTGLAQTSSALTLDTNIRLLRARNLGGEVAGNGRIGFYFIGEFLTYAEMRTLQTAVRTFLLAKGRITAPNEVVCFGDSVTAGTGSTGTSRYSFQLATLFTRREKNFGLPSSRLRTVNTTVNSGYDRRAELTHINVLNAIFILQYGVNDIASDGTADGDAAMISDFTTKLTTICNELIALGVSPGNIQIGSPNQINNGASATKQSAWRDGSRAAAVAAGVKFADVYQKFVDNGGVTNLSDTLHPNNTGHTLIADCHFNDAAFV